MMDRDPMRPRVEPLPFDEWTPETKAALGRSRDTVLAHGGVPAMPDTFFGRHPRLFKAWSDLMAAMVGDGDLPGRERELAIMRTGWLAQQPFTWALHAGAKSDCDAVGITRTEVEQVITGPSDVRWSPRDRDFLAAVDEFYTLGDISDAVWSANMKSFDGKQMMEMMMIITNYRMIGQMEKVLRIDFGPDFQGLQAR